MALLRQVEVYKGTVYALPTVFNVVGTVVVENTAKNNLVHTVKQVTVKDTNIPELRYVVKYRSFNLEYREGEVETIRVVPTEERESKTTILFRNWMLVSSVIYAYSVLSSIFERPPSPQTIVNDLINLGLTCVPTILMLVGSSGLGITNSLPFIISCSSTASALLVDLMRLVERKPEVRLFNTYDFETLKKLAFLVEIDKKKKEVVYSASSKNHLELFRAFSGLEPSVGTSEEYFILNRPLTLEQIKRIVELGGKDIFVMKSELRDKVLEILREEGITTQFVKREELDEELKKRTSLLVTLLLPFFVKKSEFTNSIHSLQSEQVKVKSELNKILGSLNEAVTRVFRLTKYEPMKVGKILESENVEEKVLYIINALNYKINSVEAMSKKELETFKNEIEVVSNILMNVVKEKRCEDLKGFNKLTCVLFYLTQRFVKNEEEVKRIEKRVLLLERKLNNVEEEIKKEVESLKSEVSSISSSVTELSTKTSSLEKEIETLHQSVQNIVTLFPTIKATADVVLQRYIRQRKECCYELPKGVTQPKLPRTLALGTIGVVLASVIWKLGSLLEGTNVEL